MPLPARARRYRRILLKLSGEALMGEASSGIDPQVLRRIAAEIAELVGMGVQTGLVVGGGNFLRGKSLASAGIDRVTGDHMGMLATIINALALADALRAGGVPAHVMSALGAGPQYEAFDRQQAVRYLEAGCAVIFAAGTGNPLFTTDSAASLRAIEIGAELLLKATKVDGIYSADPTTDAGAERFQRINYDEVLRRELGVMDLTAVLLCRDHGMSLVVFNLNKPGALLRVLSGEDEGTVVERG